jgi:hypothetical protein
MKMDPRRIRAALFLPGILGVVDGRQLAKDAT